MTISLPTAMLAKIEHARQMEDRTRSEFVRQAIRVYLAQGEPEPRPLAMRSDGAIDTAKRHLEEAAGAIADDEDLREEGKLHQAAGEVEDAAGRVVDRVPEATREAKDRI